MSDDLEALKDFMFSGVPCWGTIINYIEKHFTDVPKTLMIAIGWEIKHQPISIPYIMLSIRMDTPELYEKYKNDLDKYLMLV